MNREEVIRHACKVLQQVGTDRTANKLAKIWNDRYGLLERFHELNDTVGFCYRPFGDRPYAEACRKLYGETPEPGLYPCSGRHLK